MTRAKAKLTGVGKKTKRTGRASPKSVIGAPPEGHTDWSDKISVAVNARNATKKSRKGKSPTFDDPSFTRRWKETKS